MDAAGNPRTFSPSQWTFAILVVALLFVLMPFLFWNATWFGRPLTGTPIGKSLADPSHPREIQDALTQMESRIESRDPSPLRWYPQLVALAGDPVDKIRVTDAWLMGQDNTSPDFHHALFELVTDPNPMVQRNAALSLIWSGDDSAHAWILRMLHPYEMQSPLARSLSTCLKLGDVVNPGTLVARMESSGRVREVRAAVPGTISRWLVSGGSALSAGQPILTLAPSNNMA
jgi:hypothetical protein